MKEHYAAPSNARGTDAGRKRLSSEKGVVLVMVIILSAIALLIVTTLIYMITTGTQASGLQKRFKTALEAGEGGADVFYQLIALRGVSSDQAGFIDNLGLYNIVVSSTTPSTCSGTSGGVTYTGVKAKLMSPSSTWVNCSSDLAIDSETPATYDMRVELGATTRYNVYAKIVATIEGNSGGDLSLQNRGVVSSNSGEVAVTPIPYLYAIEVVSENKVRDDERAKLSVLYQY